MILSRLYKRGIVDRKFLSVKSGSSNNACINDKKCRVPTEKYMEFNQIEKKHLRKNIEMVRQYYVAQNLPFQLTKN